jgi:hypothetical protein
MTTHIFGQTDPNPGVLSYPSTLLTGDGPAIGIKVKQGSGSTRKFLEIKNHSGTVVSDIDNSGNIRSFGGKIGAASGVFNTPTCLDATQNPPCLSIEGGARIWGGTGAPASGTVGTGRLGDLYLRRDTPSTANQRLYICTTAGTPGTWTGIA